MNNNESNNNNYTNNNDISVNNLTNNSFLIKSDFKNEKEIIDNIVRVLKKLIKLKKFDALLLERPRKPSSQFFSGRLNQDNEDYLNLLDLNGIQLFYTTNDVLFEEAFNEIIFTPIMQSLIIVSEIMVKNNLGESINYYSKEIFKDERIDISSGISSVKRPRDQLMKKAIKEIYFNDLELIVEVLEIYKENKMNLTRFQVDNALYKYMVLAKYYGGKIVFEDLKAKGWDFNEKQEYSVFEKIHLLRKLQIIGQYSKLFHPYILINYNNNNNINNSSDNNKLFPLLQYKNIRNIISILTSKDLIMLINQDYQFYNSINNDIKDTFQILESVYELLPSKKDNSSNSSGITWDQISKDTFFIKEDQIKIFNGLKQFENLFPIATKITNEAKMNIKEAIKLPKLNQVFQNDHENPELLQYNEYKNQIKQLSNENPTDHLIEISNKKKQLKDKIIYGYLLNNHIQHLNNNNGNISNDIVSKSSTNKFSKKYKQFIQDNQLINNKVNNHEYNWESEPTVLELLFHNNHSVNIKSLKDKYLYRLEKLNNIQSLIESLKQFINIKTNFQLIVYRRTLSSFLNECERQIYSNWPNKSLENYQTKYQIKNFNLPIFQNEQELETFIQNYLINTKQLIQNEINNLKINFSEQFTGDNDSGGILEKLINLNQSINDNWYNLFVLRKNINLYQKRAQLLKESQWVEDGIEEIKSIIKSEDLNCIEFLIYLCFESIIDEIEYYQEFKIFSKSIKILKSYYSHSSLKFSSIEFPLDKLKPLGSSQSNRNSKSINILLQLHYLIDPLIIVLNNKMKN